MVAKKVIAREKKQGTKKVTKEELLKVTKLAVQLVMIRGTTKDTMKAFKKAKERHTRSFAEI